MNNTHDKIILAIITLFIDIALIYILFYTCNTNIDKAFIYFYIIIHLVFYVVLVLQCQIILDICHFFVFMGIYGSLCLNNVYLVSLCLFLLVIIKISFKLHNNRCILETKEHRSYGYFLDKYYSVIQNVFIVLLAIKIYIESKTSDLTL